MGILAWARTQARDYWLWSIPLVLGGTLAAWLVLDRLETLLALIWLPVGLFMVLRPAPIVAPVVTHHPRPRPQTEDGERLDKAYWERRLQAARQRRAEQRLTPIADLSVPVSKPTPQPQPQPQRKLQPTPSHPQPITLSPEQRRALARKLAPQVYQRVQKQAPNLPPDKMKQIVIREVQRLIDRKLQAANQARTGTTPPPATQGPAPTPTRSPATQSNTTVHSSDATPKTPRPRPVTPTSLDPARQHARQREVAQILDAARKNSQRARVMRRTTPAETTDKAPAIGGLPRETVSYRTITECMSRCNSNVERSLLEALVEEASLKPQKTALKGVITLEIQVKMFKYNVDFLVNGRLAVEVVEFAYNNDKMTQIRDRIRGNTLSQAGFLGMQIPARDILADPQAVARKIIDTARRLDTPIEDKVTQR